MAVPFIFWRQFPPVDGWSICECVDFLQATDLVSNTSGSAGEVVPLVVVDADGQFVVNEAAVGVLEAIDSPVSVLVVAGPYRSGKSFLMNRLFGVGASSGKGTGFEVGHTVQSCTKGIWCCFGADTSGAGETGTVTVVLDTEGLAAVDRSAHFDDKVFTLAALLASQLVYNTVGSLSEKSIQQLAFVGTLCRKISEKATGDGCARGMVFPALTWVLRDFTLRLEGSDGRPISSDTYLERQLADHQGYDSKTAQRNRTCAALRRFFPNRRCVTLVRPAEDEKTLQNLATVPPERLRPEFLEQVAVLRKTLLDQVPAKTHAGCALNGAGLVALLRSYVVAINSGGVPAVAGAWEAAVKAQSGALLRVVRAQFNEGLGALRSQLPLSEASLDEAANGLKEAAVAEFQQNAPIGSASQACRLKHDCIASCFYV